MTVTGQATVSYTYDNANRLTQIQQGTDTVTFGYDNAGRRTTLTLPNGVTTTSTFDAASRLTGLSYTHGQTTLGTLTYAYDVDGNRIQTGGTWARTGMPTVVSSATYNGANQQVSFGGQTLTFDLNGNLTSDGTTTYTWNARNQLAGLRRTGLTASFTYDGTGRRRSGTTNSTQTTFLYDGLNAVQETDPGGTALLLTGLGIDTQLRRIDGAGSVSLLVDGLGSTLALTDVTAAVTTSYTYAPFGGTVPTGAATGSSFQYTGRENDGLDLYYYRARYYHPRLQRFVSEDPIGFLGGDVNLYAYVRNSPLRYVDPLGLYTSGFQVSVSAGAGGGIGVTVAVIADTTGQIGISVTGGIGGYGGIGASGTFGGQFSTASTIQDLRGAGISTNLTISSGLGIAGEAGYFAGAGYQGGSLALGVGGGTPVSWSGFVTGTQVWCLFLCNDGSPPPVTGLTLPPAPGGLLPTALPPGTLGPPPPPFGSGCGRKC